MHGVVAMILAALVLGLSPGPAGAQSGLPTGGQVVAGSATIGKPTGNTLSITQSSGRAVVNWNGFSIGQPNTVNFWQPSSSAAILNRVTGSTPSTIAGQLNANGQVYLVNPNGIAITRSGTVNVGGGFVASTLDVANGNFMTGGNPQFTGNGASAPVSNAGHINVGPGGYAALIGGSASNSGIIDVPLGKVGIGSGERATLDLNGDGFMQVAAPTGATTAQGQALVSNSGQVIAPGGTVEMKAATVSTAIRDAVNMSGVIQARSVSGQNGSVVLDGGAGGNVSLTGSINVSGLNSGQTGGTAIVTGGGAVALGPTARIDARGYAGGGTVRVGGGSRGQDPFIRNALTASISAGATIDASATHSGNGGNVTVWSDTTTAFDGTILANGGPAGGNGGLIETSGAGQLTVGANATVSAAAPLGQGGLWLLDPSDDLIIDANAATAINNTLAAGTSVTELTSAATPSGFGTANASGEGDIDVDAALSWNTAATLTLSAYNNIIVNSTITIGGAGGLVLTTNNVGANPNAELLFTMGQGSAQFTSSTSNPSLTINGTAYTLLYPTSNFTALTSNGDYALATSVNAGGLTIPGPASANFAGNFNGLGNTISNLNINDSLDAFVGLFGVNSGTISNFGLVGGSVSTSVGGFVGALAGANNAGTIFNVYSTTSVTNSFPGATGTGGLVGNNETGSTIAQAYATGTVTASTGGTGTGGLVGINQGQISNAYATGSVNATSGTPIGGLVGLNGAGGVIAEAYATGTTTGGAETGALVGINDATVTNGYWDTATNSATGVNSGTVNGGGGLSTANLADATTLAALNTGGTVWGNVNSQTTPYLLTNPGPVFVGTDSSSTPLAYNLVFTPAQLQAINTSATTLAGAYALAQDIDATGVSGFVPIGSGGTIFTGTFNGLGNTISNLTINSAASSAGLFGRSSGTISDVGLINVSVTDNASGANVGGLIGFAVGGGGNTTDVYTTGSVTGTGANNVGGVIGLTQDALTSSYSTATVSGGFRVGGLVGLLSGSLTNVYATGAVSANTASLVGGLIGADDAGTTVNNAYAAGPVSCAACTTSVGALIGLNNGTITNGYWDTDRSLVANGQGASSSGTLNGGGPTGPLSGAGVFETSSYVGFSFTGPTAAWAIVDIDGTLNNAAGAAGSTLPMLLSEVPAQGGVIQNAHQLQLINAAGTAANYTLGTNIDASGTGSNTDVWGAAGFVPIGGNGGDGYTGTFNGAGHTIANLTINTAQSEAGLFGEVDVGGAPGTVENVGLLNAAVSTSATLPTIGALVGLNNGGTVSSSYATGTVSAPNALQFGQPGVAAGSTPSSVGGLIGASETGALSGDFAGVSVTGGYQAGGLIGLSNGDKTFTEVYATGTVNSGDSYVGGLVGYSASILIDAYATGSVTGGSGSIVGGLAGANANSITDAYATGAVIGHFETGGLVGSNGGGITNAYYAGAVGGSGFVGALVGSNGGPLLNVYWDEDRTGSALPALGSNIGSTTNVQGFAGSATFDTASYANGCASSSCTTGFFFTSSPTGNASNAWVIVDSDGTLDGSNGATMPLLAFEYSTTITNAHQLQLMALDPTASYTLANNVDASATGSSTGFTTGTDVWGSGGFVPVGGNGAAAFTGTLNGAGYTVAGLTIFSNANDIGLFGATGGIIADVGLIGGLIADKPPGPTPLPGIGALAGFNGGTIVDSFATSPVEGSGSPTGGLVGDNAGTIMNAYAMGAVSGTSGAVGGLVGSNGGTGTIADSYATGFVSGFAAIGGLVGSNSGIITDSYYDAGTTGQPLGLHQGATGETTAALQAALPTGFTQTPQAWGIVPGTTYPYLCVFYAGCLQSAQAISGIVYKDQGTTEAGGGIQVSALVNGAVVGDVTTGANGYYYDLLPAGTIAAGGSVLVTATNITILSNGASLADQAGGSASIPIYNDTLLITTPASQYSTVLTDLATAEGSNATATGIVNGVKNLTLDATSASLFLIDSSVSYATGTVTLNAAGDLGATAPVTAATLTGSSVGGMFINAAASDIATFGPWSDTGAGSSGINVVSTGNLATSGTISSQSGPVQISSDATLTVATGSSVSGSGVVQFTSGTMAIDGNIDATETTPGSGATVGLSSAAGISQSSTSVISADNLTMSADAAVDLGGANTVGTIGEPGTLGSSTATTFKISLPGGFSNVPSTGAVSFTDTVPLTVSGTSGVTTEGPLTLTTTGAGSNLTLNGVIDTNGNTLTLGSSAAITDTASANVSNGTLTGSAVGSVTLTLGSYSFKTLGAFSSGSSFSLSNSADLNVTGPISAPNLVDLATAVSSAGTLTLSGNIQGNTAGTAPTASAILASNSTLTFLGGTVDATATQLYANGSIIQSAGALDGSSLEAVTTGGSIALTQAANAITGNVTLTALNSGSTGLGNSPISFTDSNGFTVARITGGGIGGFETGIGTLNEAFLDSSGQIGEATGVNGAVITASSLGGLSAGGATFGGANEVGSLSSFNNQTSGTLSFNNAEGLTLSNVTSADTLQVSAAGPIGQGGGITATNLIVETLKTGGAQINLANAFFTNNVSGNVTLTSLNGAGTTLDAGAISFFDNKGFTVASSGGLQTGIATTGTATLQSTGAITEAGTISAASLIARTQPSSASAAITLNQNNAVSGSVTLSSLDVVPGCGNECTVTDLGSGAITFDNAGAIAIATQGGGSSGLETGIATHSSATLVSVSGAVTEQAGAVITAGSLSVTSVGGATLTNAGNQIAGVALTDTGGGTVSVTAAPTVATSGTTTLTIDGVSQTGGGSVSITNATAGGPITTSGMINVTGGALTLNAAGALTLDASIGANTVTLIAGSGGITQQAGVTVDPTVMEITSGGPVDMPGPNNVDTLSGQVTAAGSFFFVNGQALTIGTVMGVSGITTINSNIVLQTTVGDLVLDQPLNTNNGSTTLGAGLGQIALFSAGAISQSTTGGNNGLIYGSALELDATNAVTLSAANRIGASDSGGVATTAGAVAGQVINPGQGFALEDSNAPLTVGSLDITATGFAGFAIPGVTTHNGQLQLATTLTTSPGVGAPIAVNNPINSGGLAATGGEIDIAVAPGSGFTNSSTIGSAGTTAGGNIVILADTMSLGGSGATISTGFTTSGTVVLGPASPTTDITLGAVGAGTLSLQPSDIASVTEAGMLQIGYRTASGTQFDGDIAIDGDIATAANVPALALVTGTQAGVAGIVSEPVGDTITAGTLGVIAGGNVSLPINTVGTIAGLSDDGGGFAFQSFAPTLTVGALPLQQLAVTVTNGLASSSLLSITGSTGALSGVTTVNPNATTAAGNSPGNIILNAISGSLALDAPVNANNGLTTLLAPPAAANSGPGQIGLIADAGSITQTSSGVIYASAVEALSPSGSVALGTAANKIGNSGAVDDAGAGLIAGNAGGTNDVFVLRDDGFDLEVSSLSVTAVTTGLTPATGVQSPSGGEALLETTTAGNLILDQPVNAANGIARLFSAGTISESGAGLVSAGQFLNTTSVGGATLGGANTVDLFGATNTTSGNISLTNTNPFLVAFAISQSGGGSVTINNTGDLAVEGTVSAAGGGAINLTATGFITESTLPLGLISTTGTLTTSSSGGTTLNTANTVGTFNATNTTSGAIALTNTAAMLTVTGVSETGGAGVTIDNTGNLSLTGTLSAAGGGAINLSATGSLAEAALGLVSTTGTLTTSSVGGTTLNSANTVGTLNATNTTSGDVALTNTAATLTVTGVSQSGGGNVTIDNTGALSLTGTVSAAGGGAVNLTATGFITEDLPPPGLISTTGTLTTSSSGGTTLEGDNAIGTFNATNTTSGGILLSNNAAATLTVTGISQSGGGNVTIGTIGKLLLTGTVAAGGGGAIDLVADGAIGESAAGQISTTGLLTTSSRGGTSLTTGITVGSFNGTDTSASGISLTNTAATLTVTGVSQSGGGNVTIDNTGNLSLTGPVISGGGAIDLTATGAIGEGPAGEINTTGLLTTSSGSGTSLTTSISVGSFNGTDTSANGITLTNTATTLTVTGISQSGGGNVTIDNAGGLLLTGTVGAGSDGAIDLIATGAIGEGPAGAISTTGLLTTNSGSGTSLITGITVGSFNGTDTSASGIGLTNTAATLTVTGINQSGGGNVTIANTGALLLTGAVGAVAGAVDLAATGSLTESGAGLISTTGTLTTSSVGGATLDGANTVGGFRATNTTSGNISLSNTVNTATGLTVFGVSQSGGGSVTIDTTDVLFLAGTVSAGGGAINLTATGPLVETGIANFISTTGTLTTSSSGGTLLGAANTVGTFNATNTANTSGVGIDLTNTAATLTVTGINQSGLGSVTIDNAGNLSLTGTVSDSGLALNTINLTATGAISEGPSGAISTTGLLTTSSGSGTSLTTGITVGSFNGTDTSVSGIALTNTAATLTVTGVSETGGGSVAIDNTGNLSLAGSVSDSGGSTISLTATGAIGETPPAEINTVGLLITNSGNGTNLTTGVSVGSFIGTDTSASGIALTDTAASLTVPGPGGISESGTGNVTIGSAGTLILGGPISASTGNITLTSTGALSEVAAGLISTSGTLSGSSAGGATLNGANSVGQFVGFTNTGGGDISLTNAAALGAGSLSNAGGNITLTTTTGGLTIIDPVTAGATVFLNSAGGIAASAAGIDANALLLKATGAVSLPVANTVNLLAAQVTGSGAGVEFTDGAPGLAVATISLNGTTISGVTTNAGEVQLVSSLGTLTLSEPINTNNGSGILGPAPGTVVLQSDGALTQAAAGPIVAGALLAQSANGDVTLTAAANHVGANDNAGGVAQSPGLLAGTAGSGDFLFIDHNAGIQVDTVAGTPGIVSDPGDIRLATVGAGAITVNQPLNSGNAIEIAVAPGFAFANNAKLDTTDENQPITVLADAMTLASGTINAGSGAVVLGPATLGNGITLGTAGTATTLGLQQNDLSSITAGALQIGYRNPDGTVSFAGSITIAGSIQLNTGNVPELLLVTGGAVSESGGATITSSGAGALQLGVLAGSAVLTQNNGVGTLAAYVDSATPDFEFVNFGQTLTIGTLTQPLLGVAADADGFPTASVMTGPTANPLSGVATPSTGTIALSATGADLLVTQPISAATGSVGLSASNLTESGNGTVTAANLIANAALIFTFANDNQVGTLAGQAGGGATFQNAAMLTIGDVPAIDGIAAQFGVTAGGPVTLTTTSGGLMLADKIAAGSQIVTLDIGGAIDQTGGAITAGTLIGTSSGGATLTSSSNLIGTFASFLNSGGGPITLDNAQALMLGILTDLGGTVTLNVAGPITENGFIDAAALTGTSSGGAEFDGFNTVSSFAFSNTGGGDIGLTNSSGLSLGALSNPGGNIAVTTSGTGSDIRLDGAISAGGTLALVSAGAITEDNGGTIAAATLFGSSAGAASFGQSGNDIAALGVFSTTTGGANGNFTLVDGQPSALLLTGALDVGSGTITLDTTGAGITQAGAVGIDPGALLILSFGPVSMPGPNTVDTLAGFVFGPGAGLTFNDTANNLTVGTVLGVPGITTSNGAVTLTTTASGNITLDNAISAGSGAVALGSIGNFTNNVGASAIPGSGRWLIYSAAPGGDLFNGLDSGNTAIWDATFATLPPASVTQAGNRYLFAFQPTLTVSTGNLSKTYGTDDTAVVAADFTISGFQPADPTGAYLADTAATAFTGTPSVTSAGAPPTAGVAGSPYAIAATSGSLRGIDGYAVGFANTGLLTVNAAPLTITALNETQTYGTPFVFTGSEFSSAGLQNGEKIGSVTLASAGDTATAGVAGSPYQIVPSNPVGGTFNPANYKISFANGLLTVTPAPLSIIALNETQTYGTPFAFTGSEFTSAGLKNGEMIGSVTLTSAGDTATAGVAGSPYTITVSSPTGGTFNPANYKISFVNGLLTVTPAPLTITALDETQTYGSPFAFTGSEFTSAGLKNGEMIGSVTLTSTGDTVTANVAGSPYAIVPSSPTGGTFSATNYSISFVNGLLTVTPATLTAALVSPVSKVYDGTTAATLAAGNYSLPGVINGDNVILNDPSTGIYASQNAGTGIGVTVSGLALSGSGAGNYKLASMTISGNVGVITQAPLTITALNETQTYGSPFVFTGSEFTPAGLKNGEMIGAVTLASAGDTATAGVAGSPYTITVSSPTGGTFNPANYKISFVNGLLTVTPAALTITALDETQTYGSPFAFTGSEFTSAGLKNGEMIGSVTLTSTGDTATANVAGSPYAIVPSSPTGGTFSAANYTIGFINGLLTVTPATLTATLTGSVGKVYDGTNAATQLTPGDYKLSGILNGDNVILNDPTTGTYVSSNVGTGIGVTVSGLALSGSGAGNYKLASATITGNIGTITPAPLTVTADNETRSADDPDPPLTFTITSGKLFASDTLSGAIATAATDTSPAGTYPITQGTLAATPNYQLTFVDGVLTILPGAPNLLAVTTIPNIATVVTLPPPAVPGTTATTEAAVAGTIGQRKPGAVDDPPLAALTRFEAPSCSASGAPPALFVVLPSAFAGKPIGGVVVNNGTNEQTLDQSFAAAEMHGGSLSPCQVSQSSVGKTFEKAIAARPTLPRHFLLRLEGSSDKLTPQSLRDYHDALADIGQRKAYTVEVVGYSGSLGNPTEERQASLSEAQAVRGLLTQDRINPNKISVAGRGALNLALPTEDQPVVPGSRQVEIWVR